MTITTQQLAELNSQLGTARSQQSDLASRAKIIREALRLDSIPLQTRVLYARALSAAGQDSLAELAWAEMEPRMEFGLEGQFDWQFADYERGKVLERLGLRERAVELYRRQLSKFAPAADAADLPAMRDLRERLQRLETPK